MGRKAHPDHIKKEDLIKQIITLHGGATKDFIKYSKDEIVWMVFDNGLISEEERDASFVKRYSTLPCYLQTHVKNEGLLSVLNTYVEMYSMLYVRGSHLINLMALAIPPIEKSVALPTHQLILPVWLKDENCLKKAFLPERFIMRESIMHPDILNTYEKHKLLLAQLYPKSWKDLMCTSGWDNAINHMGTSYLGNVEVQVLTPLISRLKSYVEKILPLHSNTNKKAFWEVLTRKQDLTNAETFKDIHSNDVEPLKDFREFLKLPFGVNITDTVHYDKLSELSDFTWTLYNWLSHFQEKESSILPVATLGRKYSYIDHKVASYLIPKNIQTEMLKASNGIGSPLQQLFGLTTPQFNHRKQMVRKQIKKRLRDEHDCKSKKNKLRKKWKNLGRGCLPRSATIKTISTDGVGLRLCLEFIPKEEERDATPLKSFEELKQLQNEGAVCIGEDRGRVRLITSVDDNNKVQMITRKAFYNAIRHKEGSAWEQMRMKDTVWGTACAELSKAGGFSNKNIETWKASLKVYNEPETFKAVYDEQLLNKVRSQKKMRCFRRKRAFMDQSIKKLFEAALPKNKKNGKHIIYGTGDGNFSSGGKGEKSVPTTAIDIAIRRVVKVHNIYHKIHKTMINEFHTTASCHECHKLMEKHITKFQKESFRYRKCVHCHPETNGTKRNRDVNAAKNMILLLKCALDGKERPGALQVDNWFWEKRNAWATPI